jgi:hypothetical protein
MKNIAMAALVSMTAKGFALAVLYPAAFVYIAGKRVAAATQEVSTEALNTARRWEEEVETGVGEAVDVTKGLISLAKKRPATSVNGVPTDIYVR